MNKIYHDSVKEDYEVSYYMDKGDHKVSLIRDGNWEWYEVTIGNSKVRISQLSGEAPENPTIELERNGEISSLIEKMGSIDNPNKHEEVSSRIDLYKTFLRGGGEEEYDEKSKMYD